MTPPSPTGAVRREANPSGSLPTPREAPWTLGTKAETLERLESRLQHARVLPQLRFEVGAWRQESDAILAHLEQLEWSDGSLIVRSSALAEDRGGASQAGRFTSVPDVQLSGVEAAIEEVIASYSPGSEQDQVFLQPMLEGVRSSGVLFSAEPSSGAPYWVINLDESGSTDGVTSGRRETLRTFYIAESGRRELRPETERFRGLIDLVDELRTHTGRSSLDVEFAYDQAGELILLQVRPLGTQAVSVAPQEHARLLAGIAAKVEWAGRPHPYLHGQRTAFGVMPDWNPAEIIGSRPRPLALSLYRDLVTDSIWAYQRDRYGYRNLRSFPLLVSLHGLPYIDVRLSFNSFLPDDLPAPLAEKLADHYLDELVSHPSLHDKVEFEIVHSCYTLDLPERLAKLQQHGFSPSECGELASSLRRLTNRVIHGETGLWREERRKIDRLEGRIPTVLEGARDRIDRIYWLLEDCKRYGTLPFAGLARCGFIAVQMLRSMVSTGIFDAEDEARFFASLASVSSDLCRDFQTQPRDAFLERYGHLRPGSYDILSPRYDAEPERYFDWESRAAQCVEPRPTFELSSEQRRALQASLRGHGIEHDPDSLLAFLKQGIEGREYAKFVFTRSLSAALEEIALLGAEHGLSREDCSYLDIQVIAELVACADDPAEVLAASVEAGRARFERTCSLILPPLLASPDQVYAFETPADEPNFITQGTATGAVYSADAEDLPSGSILLIRSADPGYDWIFSRNIAGFVTAYGGVNSHMAIRASELGIPAVIGAGERLYGQLQQAHDLRIDCANRRLEVLKSR